MKVSKKDGIRLLSYRVKLVKGTFLRLELVNYLYL